MPTATVHVAMMQKHTFHLIFFHARCDSPHNLMWINNIVKCRKRVRNLQERKIKRLHGVDKEESRSETLVK